MTNYTRKQFIKLNATAMAAILLNACGLGNGNNTDKKGSTAHKPDTLPKPKPVTSPPVKVDLVYKDDTRYEDLRKGFNKRIDQYPAVIALCTSTAEVAAAIRYANEKGLPVAVKSGGHSMEGFSCNDGGMVINLSQMNTVEWLDDHKIKTGPGCTLGHLYDTILPRQRILPAGSCATVGLGGLTLGGGYGLFSRKYGLTCDHLEEATMVDGNGNIYSTKQDAELMWALKGGGTGNFGVVTEMVFRTHKAPPTLQAHYFKARNLTAERAAGILKTWMELAVQLPETCFSGYVLNGNMLNILVTNYEPGNTALTPLLQSLAGVMDTFHSSHIGDLSTMLKNYYGLTYPIYFRNSCAGLFKGYNDIAGFITDIFKKVVHTPGMLYQVNTLGGKVNDAGFEKLSSFAHRGFDFVSELQAYWENPAQDKKLADATTYILEITEQNGITHQYINYCSRQFHHWDTAYYAGNYPRLQAIKRRYDPHNTIRHPQSIIG